MQNNVPRISRFNWYKGTTERWDEMNIGNPSLSRAVTSIFHGVMAARKIKNWVHGE